MVVLNKEEQESRVGRGHAWQTELWVLVGNSWSEDGNTRMVSR